MNLHFLNFGVEYVRVIRAIYFSIKGVFLFFKSLKLYVCSKTVLQKQTFINFSFLVANAFLALLSLTPFLLQLLVKRFIVDIYYNSESKVTSYETIC